jgi:tetratricopeptide (TPR) repeat protein
MACTKARTAFSIEDAALHEVAGLKDVLRALRTLFGRNDSARANVEAGFARAEAGDLVGARALAKRALAASPSDSDALHLDARIALLEGDAEGAARKLEQAIASAPASAGRLYDLAEARRLCGDLAGAAAAYKHALVAQPEWTDALVALARVELARGELAGCDAALARALAAAPGHRDALLLAVRRHIDRNEAESAVLLAERAVAAAPGAPECHLMLGNAHVAAGDRRKAAAAYEAALALDPTFLPGHAGLVTVLEEAVKSGEPWARVSPPPPPSERAEGKISVIICSIDPQKYARVTANYRGLLDGEPHEFIAIHDAKSLCEGYNRGARRATGEILIFSHDDIEILTPDFADRLRAHLAHHDVLGVCGASRLIRPAWISVGWPYVHGLVAHHFHDSGKYRVLVLDGAAGSTGGLVALDGMFIATRRDVLDRVEFDAETFDGFHLYDLDFTFACHRAGFDVAAANDINMIHYNYAEGAGYRAELERYQRKFAQKYQGELEVGEPGQVKFIPAVFETPEQVAAFCAALLAARARMAESPGRSPPSSGQRTA